ncbi:MAG TPA: metallophosphoesterase [Candidatus Paceibacterota bacterium]|nr:metallophosphoesterase [Candidatus Paceibacterota bacterium]
MPITLSSISRRRFLSRSITAGAALAFAPQLFAAGRKRDKNVWALLADTHIAADRTKVSRKINMADHLGAVTRELAELPEIPAGAFVVGDCAFNSGETADYATFTELLRPVREAGVPVQLILGNHDNRERFWETLKDEAAAKRPVADRQTALVESSRVNWFVLDSLEKTLSTPGFLGSDQLDWLAKTLDANRRKPAIIILHHNPGMLANVAGVKDTEELWKIIRPRKQVKAYIFGHTHRWSVTRDESGIHLINLPPVSYVFNDTNPGGWVKATALKKGMRLEMRCLDHQHPLHASVTELKWRASD